jgi:hypothetical protein
MTDYGLKERGLIFAGVRNISSTHSTQRSALEPIPTLLSLFWRLFAKVPELTVYIYGTEVQKAWSYTSPFSYAVMSDD